MNIPPAALEAGARAIAESLRTARLTLESEDGYKPEARAAFVAMVKAWPKWLDMDADPGAGQPRKSFTLPALILPLTEKQDDKA